MNTEKKYWTEFLELYKASPALWRIKSPEYNSRTMKIKAYETLIKKLKEKYPDANREMAVRKINTFRTTYRKELKKVQISEKSAGGTKNVYEPTLWFYHMLDFLEDQEKSVKSTSTMGQKIKKENSSAASPSPHRLKKRKINEEDNLIKLACEYLENQNLNSDVHSSNPDDAFAKAWALQLKEMKPEQKLLARKLISDILYQGCIESLNTSHVQYFTKFLLTTPVATISYRTSPPHFEIINSKFETSDSQESCNFT